MNRQALLGLLDSLETAVRGLRWEPTGSPWGDYYDQTNYTAAAFAHKLELVAAFLEQMHPQVVWDLGANTGIFSRLAAAHGCLTIAMDSDYGTIEQGYRAVRNSGDALVLPLVLDLTNPSSNIGWLGQERMSLFQRGPADGVLALALMHHLVLGNNVPFSQLAECLAAMGRALIIEFVPLYDSQVQRMLALRDGDFAWYTQQAFEDAFQQHFSFLACEPIRQHSRLLYLMRRKDS